jgi:hypothetical protein
MVDSLPPDNKKDAVHVLFPLLTSLLEEVEESDDEEDDDDDDDEGEEDEDEGAEKCKDEEEEEDDDDDEGEEDMFEFSWPSLDEKAQGLVESRPLKFTSALFPPYKGYAFFPLVSALNHSCEPNCQVAYLEDGEALVFALRNIAAGEELTISYIYVHLPLAERRQQLQSYGFVCQCPRCLAEEDQAHRHRPAQCEGKEKSDEEQHHHHKKQRT